MYNYIVVGCGFAGTVVARLLAEDGKKVLMLDRRSTIAGNMYDYTDLNGVMIHKYGPHVLMMNDTKIYDFLSRFTEWTKVSVIINAFVDGKYIPLPINLNSISLLYDEHKSKSIIDELVREYGIGKNINVMELLESKNTIINSFAKDIYEKVFVGYNAKMWGLSPQDLDPSIPGRSPIRISYEDKKSQEKYEVVPKEGYTQLFEKTLGHSNITVKLNSEARDNLEIDFKNLKLLFCNEKCEFNGKVIYTAPLDELFEYKFGELPYRALTFENDSKKYKEEKNVSVVTFPNDYKKTRTSDMGLLLNQKDKENTVLVSEYPSSYNREKKDILQPSYPIINKESLKLIQKYKLEADKISNLYYVGRLAEFKYLNMEETIKNAFLLYQRIKEEEKSDV